MSNILHIQTNQPLKEAVNGGCNMAIPTNDISSIYMATDYVIRIERYEQDAIILYYEDPCHNELDIMANNWREALENKSNAWIDLSKYGNGKGCNIRKKDIIYIKIDGDVIRCICNGTTYNIVFNFTTERSTINKQYRLLLEELNV